MLKEAIKHRIRHIGNVKGKVEEAMQLMGFMTQSSQNAKELFEAMAKTKWTQQQFWSFIASMYLTPKQLGGKDEVSTRTKNIINDVIKFTHEGVGQREAGTGTAWWAYNGITGFYANMKAYKTADDRMSSLIFGHAKKVMERALVLANGEIEEIKPTIVPDGINLN